MTSRRRPSSFLDGLSSPLTLDPPLLLYDRRRRRKEKDEEERKGVGVLSPSTGQIPDHELHCSPSASKESLAMFERLSRSHLSKGRRAEGIYKRGSPGTRRPIAYIVISMILLPAKRALFPSPHDPDAICLHAREINRSSTISGRVSN